jgi:hypothetical protein
MTPPETDTLSEEAVADLITTRIEISDWTTRMVLKALDVRDNNRHRKVCRGLLSDLSKQGRIQRKAVGKDSNLVLYSANSAT